MSTVRKNKRSLQEKDQRRTAQKDTKLLGKNTLLQPNTTGKNCGYTYTYASKRQGDAQTLTLPDSNKASHVTLQVCVKEE